MIQIYPDVGLPRLCELLVSGGWTYHLYTNSLNLNRGVTLDSFEEATWPGYAPIAVAPEDFNTGETSDHVRSLSGTGIFWENTDTDTHAAWGYFVTDTTSGDLICCGQFAIAPTICAPTEGWQAIPGVGNYSGMSTS